MLQLRIPILIFLAFILASCGTTHIHTSDPYAEIHVDGEYKGRGYAKITRGGPPKTIHIEGVSQGEVIAERNVKRNLDGVTIVTGLFTNGLGFIFAWRFPKEIELYTPRTGRWDKRESVWDRPPGQDWQ